ncbi:MAG: DUF2163 domain-containing protein [Salinarimonadaceae bacterium]|nr:MAG: DUF2163 domain-containing protein [Salinarimonadaceae bacterium]
MRDIPHDFAAHLAGETTTLCRCWRLVRRDGVVLGFTDHDVDIAFGETVFAARTGLEAAEATAELGFAVSGGEIAGALVSAGIAEDDVEAGLYDDAGVETWLVNWADPQQRILLDLHSIGEIRRADGAFVAELRGLAHRLDEERGRLYRAACSADLGDDACGVAITPTEGVVSETDGALTLSADALETFGLDWFTGGALTFTGGANAGLKVEIRLHRAGGALDLWRRTPRPITPGDAFVATPGCDKRFSTCRDRFANAVNFRGFPHMPGNDFILRVPQEGEPGLDGGSLFR